MPADKAKLTAVIKWTLNKYDDEKIDGDGKLPIEVIEGTEEVPYEEYLKLQEAKNAAS